MKNKFKLYTLSVLLWTMLSAAFRVAALLLRYETDIGYLQNDWLTVTSNAVLLLGVLWCAVGSAFMASKNAVCLRPVLDGKNKKAWSICYAIAATCCFFGGLSFLTNRASNSMVLYISIGLFSISLAIFFLAACTPDATKSAEKFARLRPWFHMAGIVMLLLLLTSSYFDMTVTINGPFATPTVFALLFGCLFFLVEIREEIGCAAPKLHFIMTCSALHLCLSVGIGNLLFSLLGNTGDAVTVAEPARHILLLAVGIAALSRLLCYTEKADNAGETPPPEESDK